MENEPVCFQSLLVKTDVTALKLIDDDFLIVGMGNILSLYKLSDKTFVKSIEVFIGQKIHGLVQSSQIKKIAVYGGKQIKTCIIDTGQSILSLEDLHIECDDWILALVWIKNDTGFALLTAHNIVQIWSLSSKSLKKHFKCDVKCILYSGLLKEINNEIIVFAGTVFSQVVIWSTQSESILNRLVGHRGVIFSISYSEPQKLIVTTSDDRSVKLWSIDDNNISSDEQYWHNVKISLKFSLFGHTARVMRNVIADDYIISVGEDATMCIWKATGDLIRKQKIYQDGCLWSLDCKPSNNIIVTGSSNSGVMTHRLITDFNNLNNQIKEFCFPETVAVAKCVAISARNNIICLTEKGDLMYFNKQTNEWLSHRADDVKPCSMALSICRQYIALTDLNGVLSIFAETCKFDSKLIFCFSKKICDSRIPSLVWLLDRNICLCDKNGVISIWKSNGNHCEKINDFYLPSCKERWLTVATLVSNFNTLIVGDRCGNIHLYEKDSIHPVQTLSKVHGRLGTNFIKIENNKVITVGRDSCVKFFNFVIDSDSKKPQLHFLHYLKLPFNWVDRFIGKNGHLLCGFREIDFVIWDLEANQQLFEIKCGGGHRSWDIIKKWNKSDNSNSNQYILEFSFIKNSTLHQIDIKFDDISKSIIDSFHVKEINSLVAIKQDEQKMLLISAGEDTSLIFDQCEFNNKNINFVNQYKISKHLSSIRSLCTYQSCEKYIVFSAGGRAQVCAWELNLKNFSFECKELSQHFIKGTDAEKKGDKGWKQIEMNSDAETRFMSLACLDSSHFPNISSNVSIVLFSGCSDGFLRVFSFKHKFELIAAFKFDSKCILKVHAMIFKSHPIVITTSTDGKVSLWDFSSLGNAEIFQPIYQKQYHKAGINAIDVSHVCDNKLMITTGGDDNDIQLNIIELLLKGDLDKLSVKEVCKWHFDKYHSSQITGIKILNNEYILSVSIDQRVTLLKIIYNYLDDNYLNCEFLGQYHSSISDIQGMAIISNNMKMIVTCLYGKGIEIVEINSYL